MIKSNPVERVHHRKLSLNLMSLDHRLEDLLDGELLGSGVGKVRSDGEDAKGAADQEGRRKED